jgi:hypothetical protein
MGFGQEIKDFLSAYKQGEAVETARTDREYKKALQDALVKKTARENDPDTLAQADEKAKAELALIRARTGAVGASTALTRARQKALASAGINTPAQGDPAVKVPTPGFVQPTPIVNPDDAPVQQFAEGGFVEDDEDLDTGDDIVPTPAVGGGATDMSARSRNTGSLSGIAPQLVHDAVKGGLTYGANQMGLGQQRGVGTAAQRQKALEWQRGYGAIPEQELEAVKKAVDPEGKMTEAQRNMMALGQVYQFQINKGNPEGAQRAAFQVLQAYRLDAQRYASIAAHAAENGDLTTAAQAAVKAYANIPDGRDIAVYKDEDGKLNYSYTDAATGKTIVKGLLTPQQLAAQATGIAAGGFDKLILQAAGQRAEEATKGKGGGAGALKVGDQAKLLGGVEGAVGKLTEQAEKDKKPITPESTKALTGAAYRIQQANSHLTPDEAVTAARDIIGNTDKDAFKVEKGEDGTNTVTFGGKSSIGDKMKLKLSDDALEPLIAMRGVALAAAKKKKDDENKPGTDWKGIATSAGDAIGGIAKDAGRAVGAVGEVVGNAARAAIPDALGRYGERSVEDLGRLGKTLRNPGDVPATEPPL